MLSGFCELGTLLADEDGRISIFALKPSQSTGISGPRDPSPIKPGCAQRRVARLPSASSLQSQRGKVLKGQGKLLREMTADPHSSVRREIRRLPGMRGKKWASSKPLSPSPS